MDAVNVTASGKSAAFTFDLKEEIKLLNKKWEIAILEIDLPTYDQKKPTAVTMLGTDLVESSNIFGKKFPFLRSIRFKKRQRNREIFQTPHYFDVKSVFEKIRIFDMYIEVRHAGALPERRKTLNALLHLREKI